MSKENNSMSACSAVGKVVRATSFICLRGAVEVDHGAGLEIATPTTAFASALFVPCANVLYLMVGS
jgi:hypothetical protein